jgi:predicted GIY-YIG superfamily endonuclease
MYSCYILKSIHSNRTYIGVSNDLRRRIRQHNRIIKGGAKSTGIGYPYEFNCVISGFSKIMALQCEWLLKHPNGRKRFIGIENRIKGLHYLLTESKHWKAKTNKTKYKIWIKSNLLNSLLNDKNLLEINDDIEIINNSSEYIFDNQ